MRVDPILRRAKNGVDVTGAWTQLLPVPTCMPIGQSGLDVIR